MHPTAVCGYYLALVRPAPALLRAFTDHIAVAHPRRLSPSAADSRTATDAAEAPAWVYLQGQRWGSALPAPAFVGGRDGLGVGPATRTVAGVLYESGTPHLRLDACAQRESPTATTSKAAGGNGGKAAAEARDFIADDSVNLYYAGDFCSHHTPGVEAAVLSGKHAAGHMAAAML